MWWNQRYVLLLDQLHTNYILFASERIPFLERDLKLLPIRNITVEELARGGAAPSRRTASPHSAEEVFGGASRGVEDLDAAPPIPRFNDFADF